MDFDFHCERFQFEDEGEQVKVAIKHNPSRQWIVIVQNGEEGVRQLVS